MGLVTASLIGSLSIGGGSIAIAQDASPEASPMVECVPGEMSTEAIASPAADMASPVAEEEAAAPVGTPADEATIEAATAAVNNIVACAADPASIATLATANLVNAFGGYSSVEEAMADDFFTDIPFAGGVEVIGNVVTYDDGSVGIDVQYMQSQYQLAAEEWNLVDEGGVWKLNGITSIRAEVDGDTAVVSVALLENEDGTYSATPAAPSGPQTEVLVFQAINGDVSGAGANVEPHELVVFQLPEGADPMGLLDGSIPEEDAPFVGFVVVPNPGDRADMTLIGLPVGTYALLCFFPAPDGGTHAEHGMITTFEVTEPVEE
jgi:hypothetical protein